MYFLLLEMGLVLSVSGIPAGIRKRDASGKQGRRTLRQRSIYEEKKAKEKYRKNDSDPDPDRGSSGADMYFQIHTRKIRSVEMCIMEREQSRTGLKRSIVSKFSVSFRKIYF